MSVRYPPTRLPGDGRSLREPALSDQTLHADFGHVEQGLGICLPRELLFGELQQVFGLPSISSDRVPPGEADENGRSFLAGGFRQKQALGGQVSGERLFGIARDRTHLPPPPGPGGSEAISRQQRQGPYATPPPSPGRDPARREPGTAPAKGRHRRACSQALDRGDPRLRLRRPPSVRTRRRRPSAQPPQPRRPAP